MNISRRTFFFTVMADAAAPAIVARLPETAALSDRVLDARLSQVAVDARARAGLGARLCRDRAARHRGRNGSDEAAGVHRHARGRPMKDLAGARPEDLGSGRVGADARGGPEGARGAARRRPALHRPCGKARRALRPRVRRQDPPGGSARGDASRASSTASARSASTPRAASVGVIIESHGDFADSPSLLKILDGAAMPNVALLWDAHHTVVLGKEDPADTYKSLGRYVRHTHLKDSRPEGDRRPVRPDRQRRRAREGNRRRAGGSRLSRLLLLRVGEGLASDDRGARDRVPPLRRRDAAVPLGSRRQAHRLRRNRPIAAGLSNPGPSAPDAGSVLRFHAAFRRTSTGPPFTTTHRA